MKAARWYQAKDIRLDDIPEPSITTDDGVKIKVKWCGICGTDLSEYNRGPIFIPVDAPHPLTHEVAPVVLGHEFSGDVVEVGKGVTTLKVGDRVVVEPIIACGECPACKEGRYNVCDKVGFHGLSGGGGGFSEYTVFSERFVHKIPDELSYEKAALVEPISCGYHALVSGGFQEGQVAVVMGAGPIGLAVIECLRACGAGKIIVVQRKSVRQEYAKRSGADVVIDPSEVDAAEEIKKLTGGAGADIAFEATGSEDCFHTALAAVRYGGTLTVVSIWGKTVSFDPNAAVLKEKRIVGTLCYCNDFENVIEMLTDGRIPAEGYITKKIYIDDIVQEGFGTLTGPEKKSQVKILVTPDKSLL